MGAPTNNFWGALRSHFSTNLVHDYWYLPDCSIKLEAEEAESLRRLSGTHSDQTEWAQSSLPSTPQPPQGSLTTPPHPPPLTSSSAGLEQYLSPQFLGEIYPPLHGPLSPILPISISEEFQQSDCFVTPGSSPPTGAWDNYADRSSYEIGEHEFWSQGRDIKKIPIVTTDISSLGFSSSESSSGDISDTVFTEKVVTMAPPSTACTEAANKLVRAKSTLQCRIDFLDPDEIDASYLHTIPEELNNIRDLLTDYMVQVKDFVEAYNTELEASVVTNWQEESKTVKKSVLDHKKLVWQRCNAISPATPLSQFEVRSLQNQTKQLSLQEAAVGNTAVSNTAEEQRVLGVAAVRYDDLVERSKKILGVIRDRSEEELMAEEDETIRKYMREISDMKTTVEKFQAEAKAFKELTVIFKLSPDKHQNVEYYQLNVDSKFATYM